MGRLLGLDRDVQWRRPLDPLGLAWTYPWERSPGPGPNQVTITDPGERVVFDLRTGLPVVYEAGRVGGSIGYRETYRLERFLVGR